MQQRQSELDRASVVAELSQQNSATETLTNRNYVHRSEPTGSEQSALSDINTSRTAAQTLSNNGPKPEEASIHSS